MSIPDLFPPDESEYGMKSVAELKAKGSSKVEGPFLHKNGVKRWWSVDAVKLSETRYIGFVKDITERKEAEDELSNYRNNLEELVRERTKELEEKNEKLEKFNKLFVEREFRIKELKDRIKEFEKGDE